MPATPLATEIWSEYQIARNNNARRSWFVTGVTTPAQAEATAGVAEGNSHPEDSRLKIPAGGINVDKSLGTNIFKVTASYSKLSGTSPGPTPVDEPPVIFPQPLEEMEPIDRDWAGVPITNAVRQPFANQVTRAFSSARITITRNESTYQIARSLAYSNRFNDLPVTVARVGTLQKYQLLCKNIQVAQGFPLAAEYVRVIYTFEARDYLRRTDGSVINDGDGEPMSGWAKRIFNVGRMAFYKESGTIRTGDIIKLSDGKPVTKDVPLTGFGLPADQTLYGVAYKNATLAGAGTSMPNSVAVEAVAGGGTGATNGTFLIYDVYSSISFNGLNIPNSPP